MFKYLHKFPFPSFFRPTSKSFLDCQKSKIKIDVGNENSSISLYQPQKSTRNQVAMMMIVIVIACAIELSFFEWKFSFFSPRFFKQQQQLKLFPPTIPTLVFLLRARVDKIKYLLIVERQKAYKDFSSIFSHRKLKIRIFFAHFQSLKNKNVRDNSKIRFSHFPRRKFFISFLAKFTSVFAKTLRQKRRIFTFFIIILMAMVTTTEAVVVVMA